MLNIPKNHGNAISQKENDNVLATEPKNTGYCDLIEKEFKITIMKKFNEVQENSKRQYNDLKNKINEYKEYFTKWTKI